MLSRSLTLWKTDHELDQIAVPLRGSRQYFGSIPFKDFFFLADIGPIQFSVSFTDQQIDLGSVPKRSNFSRLVDNGQGGGSAWPQRGSS